MKLYIVHGTHWINPGAPMSIHFDLPAAQTAALDLVNILRTDACDAMEATAYGVDPLEPISNPEDWAEALKEALCMRCITQDWEPGEVNDLDDDDLPEHAGGNVWIEEHEATLPPVAIVVSISGGLKMEVVANQPGVEVYTLDYDVSDDTAENIIEGEEGKCHLEQEVAKVDAAYVQEIIDAPYLNDEDEDEDCGQCEGTGRTQSASNLGEETCPVCDGTGERR